MSENSNKKNQFLMPAEWENHHATWLAWPNDDDFFGDRIGNVKKIYLEIISALHKDEIIKLLVLDGEVEKQVRSNMESFGIDLSKIVFYHVKYMDVWMRDYGPMFVKNNKVLTWLKWIYDGYGKKFSELLPDNNIFLDLKDSIKQKMIETKTVLEGGAIDVNGLGTILTTEECLLEHRNKGMSKEENNSFLAKFIGATNVIWLKRGLINDHTDGHIDEIARFVSPSKILCAYEDDISRENYSRLLKNYGILKNAKDQDGNSFEVVKLPMPHMLYDKGAKEFNGKEAPVSYTNFYIGNKSVLVSIFDDPNDEKALSIIKECFPNKKIIGINCRNLIYGGGAIHCITQQEPEL